MNKQDFKIIEEQVTEAMFFSIYVDEKNKTIEPKVKMDFFDWFELLKKSELDFYIFNICSFLDRGYLPKGKTRKDLIVKGLVFPRNEDELNLFNETHNKNAVLEPFPDSLKLAFSKEELENHHDKIMEYITQNI